MERSLLTRALPVLIGTLFLAAPAAAQGVPRLDSYDGPTNIQPRLRKDTPEFRFNWCSPILLSPHNSKTVFFGGNFLFRSDNRGDTWRIISPDLTRGKPGPSAHRGHTITTIAESPLKEGTIYVGTDDGNVMVTQDGGKRWFDLTSTLSGAPQGGCVSRLEASRFQENLVYVSIDRHRNDDRAPYLFRSADAGESWTSLASGLPAEGPVYVVREDPRSPELLYVGTEFGLFFSLDGGSAWHRHPHLPTVPVHDLAVHPRERELVIATHGRGIYVMDVTPLQELAGSRGNKAVHLCDVKPARAQRRSALSSLGVKHYAGTNPSYGAVFGVYLREAPGTPGRLTISNGDGTKVIELPVAAQGGLQRLVWDLNREGTDTGEYNPVPSGEYTATLRVGNTTIRKSFQVAAEE